jgi:uncharacterized protein
MKITGEQSIPFPVETVWDALLDPAVLVRTIPGCERLETVAEHTWSMTVSAGVAAIRGTYDGTCAMSDLEPHESLVMRLQGAGAPGTIDATVDVGFAPSGDGGTRVTYDADAVVGGMVGGVGQRMLTSVSNRMVKEFFDNVAAAIGGAEQAPAAAPGAAVAPPSTGGPGLGQVFTAPRRPPSSQQDFLQGVAVGAGLVLLGVLAGSLVGRRRR